MTYDEFWFKRTFPQILLLVQARIERNERAEAQSKDRQDDKPKAREYATVDEMTMISKAFGG